MLPIELSEADDAMLTANAEADESLNSALPYDVSLGLYRLPPISLSSPRDFDLRCGGQEQQRSINQSECG